MKMVQVTSEAKASPIMTALTMHVGRLEHRPGRQFRDVRPPPPSAICPRARRAAAASPELRRGCAAQTCAGLRPDRRAEPAAPAGQRARTEPEGPRSAAQTKATPATASPAQAPHMISREKSDMSSYFGPVADQVVIDTGQFDRFGVVPPKPLHQGLNRGVEIEDQAAGVGISYHALQPEKRRNPHTSCDRA